jgi:glyoxylase-like metal-dependent hydrolase (beta-lactamase superfamily II)
MTMADNSLLEISDGVYLFVPPPDRIAGWRRSANVALLEGERSLFLIDTGGPSARKQLAEIVREFMQDKEYPVHCIHTHGHIDHMAGAPSMKEMFGAEIWAPSEAIPFVEQQSPIFLEREHESLVVPFRDLFTAPSWFVLAAMRVALGRTRSLESVGDLDDVPGLLSTEFRPIELPGHHHGHTGFFNDQNGILIAGDLIDPRHRMKPILTSPSSDFQMMKESLESVQRLSPAMLIPGHGNPILGEDEIQSAIERSLLILDEALEAVTVILEDEACSLPELASRLTRMGLGPGDVFRRMFIHSILRHLVDMKRLHRQTDRRKVLFSL